jgi:hypothetical protein
VGRLSIAGPVAVALSLVLAPATRPADNGCSGPAAGAPYTRAALAALGSTRDVWGEALLSSAGGPTAEGVRRHLAPLLFARRPHGHSLTASGVYYVPLSDPPGPQGASSVELHVADGSQLLSRRVGGPSLTAFVGGQGAERYGSCLGRLVPATLKDGWLPVLETAYIDAAGVHYRQESFATRFPGTTTLASFVSLTVDGRAASNGVRVRFVPSPAGHALVVEVPPGAPREIRVAWVPDAAGGRVTEVDEHAYDSARGSLARRWQQRLSGGMQISVPDGEVENAERALIVQNLVLGWRYSIGNPYEELSFPEGPDLASVMGELGFADVDRAILEASLTRSAKGYPSWKDGERMFMSASYYRLSGDAGCVDRETRTLSRFLAALEHAYDGDGHGLLARERYSADIADPVFGTHAQTVAWAGLRAMAGVWRQTGHRALAERASHLASRLEVGLRAAVRSSERRLPDGSLFVPARLLDGEAPYTSLVETRLGSYWNLVMPFALSSGFFAPGGAEAQGILRYMLGHGSRLLGLVRAGAYALYGRTAPFPVSGTDEVYGVDVARFLADNDRSDQLVLSLYGELAAAMTPGTFVAGEGATVAPLEGASYRAMYLPPNSESNAAFLETLRVLLVHETADVHGTPYGLELAFSTPRAWLGPGEKVAVTRAPTSFGPVSFSIAVAADGRSAHVDVVPPSRESPKHLAIRLRLPAGVRIEALTLGRWLDTATGTIDLTAMRGAVDFDVRLAPR